MSDLQSYLDVASDKVQAILRQQYKAAAESAVIICPCGHSRALSRAYRCLYCGLYFCEKCAERHFGKTRLEWYAERRGEKVTIGE